ncbi:conserved hypothetical protein [Methylobacterium sp. 4-46]|uniref:hypothetical protein n=1 Tax=unclassified Methylobacterium TaxID=2615210 RepID=UPI000152D1B6|nr:MULTISPECIES: hypothetical protein [Methylobacterium]ACA15542.1 conserved hypothetical protein [Methylobacterium sp. 4-46]WFT81259.1 hypothetical protein QA634_05015 [Methylobacterium nodulans]
MLSPDLPADPTTLVHGWNRGLASLSLGQPPCPGLRLEDWATILENCRHFVGEFSAEAAELGWDTLTLFSVRRQAGMIRGDWRGVMGSTISAP